MRSCAWRWNSSARRTFSTSGPTPTRFRRSRDADTEAAECSALHEIPRLVLHAIADDSHGVSAVVGLVPPSTGRFHFVSREQLPAGRDALAFQIRANVSAVRIDNFDVGIIDRGDIQTVVVAVGNLKMVS